MENKIDPTHYLLMYLTGFGFFSYQVYTQLLYSFHGLAIVLPFIIGFLIMPLIIFYVCKKINNGTNFEHKKNFVFNILTIVYLSILGLLILNYCSVMTHNYYYQSTKSYIIAAFLLIPVLYVLLKNSKIYYSLAYVLFFVFLLFNFFYGINHETTDIYPLYNIFNINDLWYVIILTIPIILDPIILLANIPYLDTPKKINIKFILPISILISLLAIYTIIRQSMEFGLLIKTMSFPYFESGKFMSIKSNFDNIDYYYLFLITIALFSRLPMLYFNIKDSFKIKAKGILILILATLVVHYYIQKKLEFYKEIVIPSLIFCSILLIILLIMSIFSKRSPKNAK